jgi:hypothetical protein
VEEFSPELFSRLKKEIYIAGLNSTTIALPDIASDVEPNPEAIARLKRAAQKLIQADEEVDVVRESLVSEILEIGLKHKFS